MHPITRDCYEGMADDVERFLKKQGALRPDFEIVAKILLFRHEGQVKKLDELNERTANLIREMELMKNEE